MRKLSVKKLSVLGLVLMAASATTAAIFSSKSSEVGPGFSADNGTRQSLSGGGGGGNVFSCISDIDGVNDQIRSCHLSKRVANPCVDTATGAISSIAGCRTVGNTSNSNPLDGQDTTSQQP